MGDPAPRRISYCHTVVLDNCRNRYYGRNPLYPTGPVLFGRALAAAMAQRGQAGDADDQWIGVSEPITPGKQQENVSYIAPDSTLVALRVKKIGGDLAHLGAKGTNNYNTFWHRRQAYGEGRAVWLAGDEGFLVTSRASRAGDEIEQNGPVPGLLTYGPYIDLEPGRYVWVACIEGNTDLPRMKLDVAHSAGKVLVEQAVKAGARPSPCELRLPFATEVPLRGVEFRIESFGYLRGKITQFRLEGPL